MDRYIPVSWRCEPDRWNEMKFYCRQYDKLKQERTNIRLEYRAAMSGSISVRSSSSGSPVEEKADRLMKIDERLDNIESCCREATQTRPDLYVYLLKAVTQKIGDDKLGLPITRMQFSKYKRLFFYLLDRRI